MKRRSFLSMLAAAGLVPALPGGVGAAPVAAAYNRYMYGLAVFHARTRASVSAADLMTRLKISAVQADAMIGEMTARGVVAPALNATKGAMQAIEPHHRAPAQQQVRAVVDKAREWIAEAETGPERRDESSLTTSETEESPTDGQETDNGQV